MWCSLQLACFTPCGGGCLRAPPSFALGVYGHGKEIENHVFFDCGAALRLCSSPDIERGCPMPRTSLLVLRPVALACLALWSAQVGAQQAEPVVQPEVVVTAVHDQSPIQLVIDPKQPRQPVPASDAADYLKSIPGFSALRSGGSNSDPVFRGQFGSRLPLLTNGAHVLGPAGAHGFAQFVHFARNL